MKGTSLGEFEELVLLAVAILDEDAYGVAIMDEIETRTKRTVTISTIHATLNRLEGKGFLDSHLGGATSDRGGRSKRLFDITASGRKAMENSRDLRNAMWQSVPGFNLNII